MCLTHGEATPFLAHLKSLSLDGVVLSLESYAEMRILLTRISTLKHVGVKSEIPLPIHRQLRIEFPKCHVY